MMHQKLTPLLCILSLVGFFWIIVGSKNPSIKFELRNSLSESNVVDLSVHPLVFFDKGTFYMGLDQVDKESEALVHHIAGGIIPHHLFPGFIIANFFSRLSTQKPKTVILIGPNHYERGNFKALTSVYGWQTPFGVVEPNKVVINDLIEDTLMKIDEKVVSEDHSVAGIMPFVKHYLSDAQVVPILLSSYMSQEELQILANSLKDYMDKDTVIIAAVDFSHYLTNLQAQEKDKTTLELMKSFNYKQLLSLNNDYLDSSSSIATLLMVMQKLGTTKMDLLYHTNSGELQKNDYIETTSYFSIAYY